MGRGTHRRRAARGVAGPRRPRPKPPTMSAIQDVDVNLIIDKLLDVRGALVEEVDLGQHAAGPLRHALQLEDAPSGLYLLELRLDGRGLERQRMLLLR